MVSRPLCILINESSCDVHEFLRLNASHRGDVYASVNMLTRKRSAALGRKQPISQKRSTAAVQNARHHMIPRSRTALQDLLITEVHNAINVEDTQRGYTSTKPKRSRIGLHKDGRVSWRAQFNITLRHLSMSMSMSIAIFSVAQIVKLLQSPRKGVLGEC